MLPQGLKRPRENYLVREDVEHDERGFSRVAAAYESPTRKCRVKWNKCASPVGTTPVLTNTLFGRAAQAPAQTPLGAEGTDTIPRIGATSRTALPRNGFG